MATRTRWNCSGYCNHQKYQTCGSSARLLPQATSKQIQGRASSIGRGKSGSLFKVGKPKSTRLRGALMRPRGRLSRTRLPIQSSITCDMFIIFRYLPGTTADLNLEFPNSCGITSPPSSASPSQAPQATTPSRHPQGHPALQIQSATPHQPSSPYSPPIPTSW